MSTGHQIYEIYYSKESMLLRKFDRNRYGRYMLNEELRIQINPTRQMASLRRRRSLRLAGVKIHIIGHRSCTFLPN